MKKTRIHDKLNEGLRYLDQINLITTKTVDEFFNDEILKRAAERLFEILAQIMIDVCTQIVATFNSESPLTYSECFSLLSKENIISEENGLKYGNISKMRNLVTHQYGLIDHELLFMALSTIEDDYKFYRETILKWIKSNR